MVLEGKSPSAIASNIMNRMSSNLSLDSITPGGVIYTISLAVGNGISKIYSMLVELYSNTYLSESGGPYLDALGSFIGVRRLEAKPIEEISGVRFYTYNSNPLSDYIDASFFQSAVTVNVSGTENNLTVKPFTLTAEQLAKNYVDVTMRPLNVSRAYAEKNTLTSYTPNINGLVCSNKSRIRLISTPETDNQFRYRISRYLATHRSFDSRQTILSNKMMLRIAALSVPGVADVIVDEYAAGSGSLILYVIGEDLLHDESLIPLVESKISSYAPYGIKIQVENPQKIYVTIRATVYSQNVVEAINDATTRLRELIDSIPPGGSINRLDIHNTLFKTSGVLSADNIEIKLSYVDKVGISHSRIFTENVFTCGQFEKLVASSDLIVISW